MQATSRPDRDPLRRWVAGKAENIVVVAAHAIVSTRSSPCTTIRVLRQISCPDPSADGDGQSELGLPAAVLRRQA